AAGGIAGGAALGAAGGRSAAASPAARSAPAATARGGGGGLDDGLAGSASAGGAGSSLGCQPRLPAGALACIVSNRCNPGAGATARRAGEAAGSPLRVVSLRCALIAWDSSGTCRTGDQPPQCQTMASRAVASSRQSSAAVFAESFTRRYQ